MSPKVSILLAVHNAAKTLPKTLKSLNEQTFQDFDVVVVDDASTDASPELLRATQKNWGQKKLRILINRKNLGLTKSLNCGLKRITAPLTARIDADDWWHPEKLAKQVEFLESHPDYGLLGCAYINVGASKSVDVFPPRTNEEIRKTILRRNPFAHSCVMFRTTLIRKLGGYDPQVRYGQDYDLWFRCLPLTKLANLPDKLCYRQVGSGISVDKQRQQMIQSLRTQAKYIRRYHWGLGSYLAMLEPLAVVLAPDWLKKIKRRLG